MREYPSPCDSCTKKNCVTGGCLDWKIRYLYRQKQINGYAKKHKIPPTTPPMQNPCETCGDEDCDEICEARARYWDAGMERLRKQVGM